MASTWIRFDRFYQEEVKQPPQSIGSTIKPPFIPGSGDLTERLAASRARLSDPQVISGDVARARHAAEWERRRAHDRAFANTLVENTILELERIGKDRQLTAEESLRRVAEMVLPRGSRVEVTRAETGRFRVRAAFRLSAFIPTDAAGATTHKTVAEMKSDLEDATARVLKDLFDYCGLRGIESVSVSCNSVVTASAKDAVGKPETEWRHRSLYRVALDSATASKVASWRDITVPAVKRLMKVERDLTPTLTLIMGTQGRPVNLAEPLEF